MTKTTDDISALGNELRLACQRISRRVRYESADEVAPHQFSMLVRLVHGDLTPTQIAEIERVSTPSATRTLNCLHEAGLVDKSPHPDDGRQVIVSLTDAGRELIGRTLASRDSWMTERLIGMSAADLHVLRRASVLLAEVAAK